MNDNVINKILDSYNAPIYVFDIEELKRRIAYLKASLPKRVELCYAIKANTFVINDIEDNVERFEVCSPGEYEICKQKSIVKGKIVISGIYKTPEFIKNMINSDKVNCYTIESMEQFELFKSFKTSEKINLLLRVTSGNQFGIDESELNEIIENIASFENLNIKGIQYFSGTQKISMKGIRRELEYLDELLERLYNDYGYKPEELEYGGGFPVYYFENTEFNEEEYLKEFSEILNSMKYQGRFIIELGRSIVASSGYYFTKVVDMKVNKGQKFAIVDGGMNHIVYYGQSMAMKTPKCEVLPRRENINSENWNICGALCTINDILIKQFPVTDLKLGDFIMFKNTGAYCPTEGIAMFLSRDLPKISKLIDGEKIEIVRENLPTYKFNM